MMQAELIHNEIQKRYDIELSESLKYASYIQQAIFPSKELIDRIIPDNFIIYKPRNIVSGDFYYVAAKNNLIYVSVGDCTGHGVPGALMSILGITFLNEIVAHSNFTSAGPILNRMREHVMAALCQTGEDSERKDGIDIALCIIDTQTEMLSFAGAFNPVYIVRENMLHEIPGDMMPVGVGAEEELCFSTQTYELNDKDVIYLFTDGFADQFGGPQNKKFKFKEFRNLLKEVSGLEVLDQKKKMEDVFDNWKKDQQQVDDVLIFGFRYHSDH